jgi:hypothetical protein
MIEKNEKAIPALAQFLTAVLIRSLIRVVVRRLWSAVKQKLTNHMKAHSPLTPTSTIMMSIFNCMEKTDIVLSSYYMSGWRTN